MNKRRKFTPEFKSQVVLQLLSGERNMAGMCREHQLTAQMVGNWKQQFLAGAPQVFQKGETDSTEQARIAELERMVGKLTMELEIAKKASSLLAEVAAQNSVEWQKESSLVRLLSRQQQSKKANEPRAAILSQSRLSG
jgi:transposase-like protein